MKHLQSVPQKRLLTSALLLALAHPAMAQVAQQDTERNEQTVDPAQGAQVQTSASPTTLDAITVTGIRGSLTSSMNLKRDAQGIVDGIVAEDIGKFPDTNLAESLQRISGVSIDRSLGEGSKVTVRGVGPDFNLVLLNGRQMPASNLGGGGAEVSASRAFDFANLASEAISEIQVYKSARASTPAGGIGATLNILTARPLDNPGLHANVGVKAVHDTSYDNVPESIEGDSVTPEISGIFSNTYADGKFGVSLTGSYQERDFGFSQASVANGWAKFQGPFPTEGSEVTNPPEAGDIYSRPQNTGYSVNSVQRQRTNGQLTLQYAPTERVTTTLDYTYAENKIQQQRSELSVWFNWGPGETAWTDGPVAAPNYYSEYIPSATGDVAMGGAQIATVNELDSLGFNVEWEVTDSLDLEFDYHDSTAESRPDSPYGSAGVLSAAAFVRGNTGVDYSGDLPIVNYDLPSGVSELSPSQALVTGSVFHNTYTRSDIEQSQLKGRFEFGDYSGLDFGVAFTEVDNRTAHGYMQRDTWGGVGTPDDYDDSIWTIDDMSQYFDAFSGHDDPNFSSRFLVFDFDALRDRAVELTGRDDWYRAPDTFTEDLRTNEKSRSAFLQYTTTFDWQMPLHVAAGMRYEQTDVTSSALVPTATGIEWGSANELNVVYGDASFTELEGDYDYWLPNLDLSLDITDQLVLRGSAGRTIGRPGWRDIQGGQTLAQIVRVDGGDGSQGNPGLEPLLSDNYDLSLEWYYGEGSYVSVGYFRKNIDNYVGVTQIQDTPFNLNTPVGGDYWNAALASGCLESDRVCIRNYILRNFDGQPGVDYTGDNANGEATGIITGQPGDPIANFDITVPANQQSASLDGWEFNVQHVFGDSGFGLSANYTIVDSGLVYDNEDIGEQFALEGLSDSANLVGFYDKGPWQVRLAYNWRDEFLSGRFDGQGPNPAYTEEYGQLDANVSYQFNDRLTLALEGINLTDETIRVHGRHENQVLWATQNGPRYMVGLRYKFF
ncbi:TonB-dependent receptor [Coralloluteibacterium stylophorae]|uniref:TonB-dependent receptor n=1 Tax=Coralloluteibacterium stylophorae TaxID=1776034 RepID=A0A8J7VW81_9GAMM|nr:TonB-dependent receptor [Coralloluteibacterium stylophorae]MBS7455567.1 TonB-dependent receptor [Coralloluteibacterium stylophorae]